MVTYVPSTKDVPYLIHWRLGPETNCHWLASITNPKDFQRDPVMIVVEYRYQVLLLLNYAIVGNRDKYLWGYTTDDFRPIEKNDWKEITQQALFYKSFEDSPEVVAALKALFASAEQPEQPERPAAHLRPTLRKLVRHQLVMHEWLNNQDFQSEEQKQEILEGIVEDISQFDFISLSLITAHLKTDIAKTVWVTLLYQYRQLLAKTNQNDYVG
jgi:hypothetical protein